MAVNLSPIWGAGAQLLDNSGNVLSGGKIYTYAAGTTTPATTYTSSNGLTANSNPIILNSAGRVPYEIWLTDGQVYKFVLKDSNDVLIATYDNLIGINSNYIAFTMQQEIQTATAGQTVFNLTTMQYQPGTNSLSVFVDGVNQYGPGAQYAYVETDTDTVTFVNGLHVGASVKFTTAQSVSSNYANAAQVTYDPPFTGAVATNVEAKLAQTVSVKDFGAVGDGVTDDSDAIRNAIEWLKTQNGGTLYFPSGVYLVAAGNPLNPFYALTVDFDGMSIIGDSLWNTEIKVMDNANVGPLHLSYVTGFELQNITLNGNYENQTTAGLHGLAAIDADYVVCTNIKIKKTVGYGIGFQGTETNDFQCVKFDGLYLEDIGGDGTDFKNKANTNKGLIFNNVYINGVGRTEPGSKKAGLDIRGPATISNVHVFANGSPVIGVRFRHDQVPGNGIGGKDSSLTNFYMQLDNEGNSDGVVVDDDNVSVSNGVILGIPYMGTGIFCTEFANNTRLANISATAAAGGNILFEIGGDDIAVVNCRSIAYSSSGVGFRINGNRQQLINCKNFNGQYGFRRNAGTEQGTITNCESYGASDSDYETSLADVTFNCYFQTTTFGSSLIFAGGNRVAEFTSVPSAVNYFRFDPSVSGSPVVFRARGDDAAIDIEIVPKGNGKLMFGSHVATSDTAISGYIYIKDIDGNLRKLAVIS